MFKKEGQPIKKNFEITYECDWYLFDMCKIIKGTQTTTKKNLDEIQKALNMAPVLLVMHKNFGIVRMKLYNNEIQHHLEIYTEF